MNHDAIFTLAGIYLETSFLCPFINGY